MPYSDTGTVHQLENSNCAATSCFDADLAWIQQFYYARYLFSGCSDSPFFHNGLVKPEVTFPMGAMHSRFNPLPAKRLWSTSTPANCATASVHRPGPSAVPPTSN
jgi:hypothetical protein